MKQMLIFTLLFVAFVGDAVAQKMLPRYNRLTNTVTDYPVMTIRQIQENHPDSLLLAEALQNSAPSRYTLQGSPYMLDTVTVEALCVVPPRVLNFTGGGRTMILYDTGANPIPWGGIFVRAPGTDEQHELDGFFRVERGDIIRMTGRVEEFPADGVAMNTVTQFAPIPGIAVEILASDQPIPPPIRLNVSDFYVGLYPGGSVKFTTGEQYESIIVEFLNLTKVANLNVSRGTLNAVDVNGNMISNYDASTWFTAVETRRHPEATYTLPPNGTIIDTIRGFITSVSGGENPRGYRIASVWDGPPGPEDHWCLGNIMPSLSNAVRNPMVVTSTQSPLISVRATRGTYEIDAVKLFYSFNWGAFSSVAMTFDEVDTLYKGSIPTQPVGTFVRYYISVVDANANTVRLASYASGGEGSDTSKGFFFYTVKDAPLTIQDIQYTPFRNGYSPYAASYPSGAVVSVSGIVTADTTDMLIFPRSTVGGTYAYYMQSGNAPWSGIWITGPYEVMNVLRRGDSVTVTGTVQEWPSFAVNVTTRIGSISSVVVHTSGNPLPAPVLRTTGNFGPGVINGSPIAEPYEGMLVKFQNVTVTNIWPYWADPSWYEINDGSGGVWVHQDGTNNFSNIPAEAELGYNVLYEGDFMSEVTGIIHFSVHRYKFVPRSNSDFGQVGGAYNVANRWNILSVPRDAKGYTIPKLYPNKTSDAFRFFPGIGYSQIHNDTILDMGYGYWLKFGAAGPVYVPGLRISTDSIFLEQGWNLIGTISGNIDVNTGIYDEAGIISSRFFGYSAGYFDATVLEPNKGYWVKASAAGKIVVTSSFFFCRQEPTASAIERFHSITITDNSGMSQTLYVGKDVNGKFPLEKYILPPPPPTGIFHARYASQHLVEVYPAQISEEQRYPILLSSVKYPITVTWNVAADEPNLSASLKTVGDENSSQTFQLIPGGSVTIKDAKEDIIILSIGRGELPKEFSLSQNYPNPFNPTTKFTVAVPKTAPVEIIVYDILGRKVRTLVSEEMSEGYHIVEWDGLSDNTTSVGTGVYFVRMKSGTFNTARKIMMMK